MRDARHSPLAPGCQQVQARRRQPAAARSGRMGAIAIAAPEAPIKASASGSADVYDVSFRVHNSVTNPPLVIQCARFAA